MGAGVPLQALITGGGQQVYAAPAASPVFTPAGGFPGFAAPPIFPGFPMQQAPLSLMSLGAIIGPAVTWALLPASTQAAIKDPSTATAAEAAEAVRDTRQGVLVGALIQGGVSLLSLLTGMR